MQRIDRAACIISGQMQFRRQSKLFQVQTGRYQKTLVDAPALKHCLRCANGDRCHNILIQRNHPQLGIYEFVGSYEVVYSRGSIFHGGAHFIETLIAATGSIQRRIRSFPCVVMRQYTVLLC